MEKRTREVVRLVGLGAGLVVLYCLLPLRGEHWWVGAAIGLAALVAITPFTTRRVLEVRRSATPVFAAAEAIMLVVAMLLFGFGALYLTISRLDGQFVGLDTRLDAVYFALATLSTVGYGDVHAAGQLARAAVSAQIVLDLTLIAISVRLITAAARRPSANPR
jgi:hypothetical protein